jgi:hypothetical protein
MSARTRFFSVLILADLDGPGLDDIHGIALIALFEDDLAFINADTEEVFSLTHGSHYSIIKVTNGSQIPENWAGMTSFATGFGKSCGIIPMHEHS